VLNLGEGAHFSHSQERQSGSTHATRHWNYPRQLGAASTRAESQGVCLGRCVGRGAHLEALDPQPRVVHVHQPGAYSFPFPLNLS
jgi:hypothetical protein